MCQHLNRICSGCSHLIHTVPRFQSLFQSFYLSLKALNCFLSVSRLESAQVSGWRYPLGHGIVALSPPRAAAFARTPGRPPQSHASAATTVSGVHGRFQSEGFGGMKENRSDGRLCSPPADFPPAKSTSPSVCLGEAGERCGKSLQEHRYLPQLLLQGFWITLRVSLLSLGAMPETWRSPHRKPALSGFPSAIGVALNYSGEGGADFQAETLETALWMMKIIPFYPVEELCTSPLACLASSRLNKSH